MDAEEAGRASVENVLRSLSAVSWMDNAMSETAVKVTRRKPAKALHGLEKDEARIDILNRLRRAEGQIRGIQRMLEQGEDCQSIGHQFSAARNALDSTYRRLTLCFAEQEIETLIANGSPQGEAKTLVLKDLETLLARMR
jgi:CsoR family transcriptional regulator, copper-sensing transcriptional repressor